jgi:hypothetical protein
VLRSSCLLLSFSLFFLYQKSAASPENPFIGISNQDPDFYEAVALDISKMTRSQVDKLKLAPQINWWTEFGDSLVLASNKPTFSSLYQQRDAEVQRYWNNLNVKKLEVALATHATDIPVGYDVIAKSGRTSLLLRSALQSLRKLETSHFKLTTFIPNTTYVRAGNVDGAPNTWTKIQLDAAKKAMNDVNPIRWYLDVGTLTNWNRHISSVDIVSARDWIKTEFDQLTPSKSSLQKFNVYGRDAWNVTATFNSDDPNSDIYIICGHYDSISERPSEAAPGAEDNATGAAGIIELARVFAKTPLNATLMFVAFSGEEQGLVGSKAFVRSLTPSMRARIKAVLNMDMIGYSKDDSEDVLLESSSRFKNLVDQFAEAASHVDGLKYFITFNPYGSDHMPFIDAGIPAILTIDNDWGDYPAYHRTSDTIDQVSRDMGAAILRMNAGALAAMLNRHSP